MKSALGILRLWLLVWCLPGIAALALMQTLALINLDQQRLMIVMAAWCVGGIVVIGAEYFR